jgi:hypothetical protein
MKICVYQLCNRSDHPEPMLDRLGWIISPEGDVLVQTSDVSPFVTIETDLQFPQRSKSTYPRNVAE